LVRKVYKAQPVKVAKPVIPGRKVRKVFRELLVPLVRQDPSAPPESKVRPAHKALKVPKGFRAFKALPVLKECRA
jgi:hypothetical protein